MENLAYFLSGHKKKQINKDTLLWTFDVQVEREVYGNGRTNLIIYKSI